MRSRFKRLLCATACAVGLPASAALIPVTTTADAVVADGACSLREAIGNANLANGGDTTGGDCVAGDPGSDTIEIPPGIYSIVLGNGDEDANVSDDFDLTDDLTVAGAGASSTFIEGPAWRLLHVQGPGTTVELQGVTLRGAGPIFEADGALVADSLTVVRLTDVIIEGNDGFSGAAVRILPDADVTLERCVIRNNRSAKFGEIVSDFGTLTILDTSVYDNWTANPSPQWAVSAAGGALLMERSSIVGLGTEVGVSIGSGTSFTISNSTIGGYARGVWANSPGDLSFVTVAGNLDSGLQAANGEVRIKNSIVADNGTDCVATAGGTFTSLGHNLDSDGTCFGAAPGDLTGVSPELGPLQSNGGSTLTYALRPPSPAIDAADPACTDIPGASVLSDQRGLTRPVDGDGDGTDACDIGAYEAPGAPPEVPDGSFGAPLRAARGDDLGSELELEWDAASCPAEGFHLLYGPLVQVADYVLLGAECDIPGGSMEWTSVPVTSLYFLIVAADADVEGSWGEAAGEPRNGELPSGQCGVNYRVNATLCH